MRNLAFVGALVAVVAGAAAGHRLIAQTELKVTYGPNGLQQLIYKGQVLEDLNVNPGDSFHIWHMKSSDMQGNTLSNGQYGWGEQNNGRSWDPASNTWTYNFSWGSIQLQYVQNGNNLDMKVTETNAATSGIVFDGATIYPLELHLQQLPAGFVDASYSQYAYNTIGPSVTLADYGAGEVASVVPDAAKPLYSGFISSGGNGVAYTAIISGTTPDGLATFQPHNDRPLMPGQTDTFTVSLRFAPSGTPFGKLAQDAYQNWAATWPAQLTWPDRRAIGTVYLASSPSGNVNQPNGFPNNPRRYFHDADPSDFDVRNPAGMALFQARILAQANNNVQNLKQMNAQGSITWDVEGQQFPQNTSYVCSPDQIGTVAPEMESVITDQGSPYAGTHLVDAYFKIMRDAGFRVGVCVRPQQFTLNADGTAAQTYLPNSAIAGQLLGKMKYAHDRWGASLFYVDSSVDITGAPLDASIFQQISAALPDSLIMPEEWTPKHYAYTAPFQTFIFHGDLGTSTAVYNYYPKAFGVNLINDVDPAMLAANQAALTASVKRGDILMAHADYWQGNNDTVLQMYSDAGVSGPGGPMVPPIPAPVISGPAMPTPVPSAPTPAPPPPTPSPTPPPVSPTPSPSAVVITSPTGSATLSGEVVVAGQIGVNLDPAGSYLMVDGNEIGTQRLSQAPFSYPLDSTTIPNGQHTLQIWAHDTANNTWVSSPVTVTVANAAAVNPVSLAPPVVPPSTPLTSTYPIQLVYPESGQGVSGSLQVSATIGQTLDAAGSYLLLDGIQVGAKRVSSAPYLYVLDTTLIAAGKHTLQIWAHDTANESLLSNLVTILVGP